METNKSQKGTKEPLNRSKESLKGTNKSPNLIFIFADQMRRDMGCAGNEQVITPNLDRIAREGFQFNNAVACFPVCAPNRACMLTGQYPTTLDVLCNDVPIPTDKRKGIGYMLKDARYKTGYIGKWHLFGPESTREAYIPPGPDRLGFEDLWAVLNCRHQYMDSYYYLNDNPEKIHIEGYEPDHQTDLALDFISQNKNDPFALFLSVGPPHDPYEQVPEKWKAKYNIEELEWKPNVKSLIFENGGWPWYKKEPNKEILRDYYAHITALDYNVGRIMDHLDALGLDEDTIVVFTSDHGEMMYSQGCMQKGLPWEESIGVPFLIRHPKNIKPNTSSKIPFNSVDIVPTLASLMSIDIPEYVEGTDYSHIILGDNELGKDSCETKYESKHELKYQPKHGPKHEPEAAYIMTAFPFIIPEWRGVRTERYTYARSIEGPMMLYDNEEDPYQLNNLVEKAEAQGLINELDALTDKLAEQAGDSFEPWGVINKRMSERNEEWQKRK